MAEMDDLLEWNRDYAIQEFQPDTLLIGSNGGGEFIGIQWKESGLHRIVLAPFTSIDAEDYIEIGHSFTDFLTRMDAGLQWFGDKSA